MKDTTNKLGSQCLMSNQEKERAESAIGDVIRELRRTAVLTQQDLAVLMQAAVSSVAGYEAGGKPNTKALGSLRDIALKYHRPDLAAIFELHHDVSLGRVQQRHSAVDPFSTRSVRTSLAVELLGRILEDTKRYAAFLEFAKPEIERWAADNKLQKERREWLDFIERQLGPLKERRKSQEKP
jgi:transcriptional regulator with XRE-family HTH domain